MRNTKGRNRDCSSFSGPELAPLRLVVLLQHGEAAHERPGIAVRTQPHVDAEHEAVHRGFADRGNELLAEDGKVFVIRYPLGAARLAILIEGEDEVDIRRHIEFAPAELAHAHHDQLLRQAALARK